MAAASQNVVSIFVLTILVKEYWCATLGSIEVECPSGWTKRADSDKCWKYSPDKKTWQEARDDCAASGGELVHLRDMYDNEEISVFVQTQEPVWIGLNRVGVAQNEATKAKWNTQDASLHEGYWDVFQPDFREPRLCVESHIAKNTAQWGFYKANTRLWAFTDCSRTLSYVCQLDVCAKDAFRCSTGKCLSKRWLCDAVDDCGTGEDEATDLCPSRCEYQMSGASGEISTDQFADPYLAQASCTWTIETPANTEVHLKFTSLDTEPIADEIQILVPSPPSDLFLLASVSGSMTSYMGQQFSSPTNQMTVRFQSDRDVQKAGFKATWSTTYDCSAYVSKHAASPPSDADVTACAAQCNSCDMFTVTNGACQTFTQKEAMTTLATGTSVYVPSCSGVIDNSGSVLPSPVELKATSQWQSISSPHYPVFTHAQTQVTWTLTATTADTAYLMIRIDDIDLRWPDELRIADSDGSSMATYPGTSGPGTLVTRGGSASVVTTTNQQTMARGFLMSYKEVDVACPGAEVRHWRDVGAYSIKNAPYTLKSSVANLAECQNNCLTGAAVCTTVEYKAASQECRLTNYDRRIASMLPGVELVADTDVVLSESLCAADCPTLTLNAQTITTPDPILYAYDSTLTLTCAQGHVFGMENQDTESQLDLKCLLGGQWSMDNIPDCQPVYCPDIPVVVNGYVASSDGTQYNDVITYACYAGFTLQGGPVTCGADGQWTAAPNCQAVECSPDPPASIAEMTITFTTKTVGSEILFACGAGYQLQGVPKQVCQADGSWTDTAPTCTKLQCASPAVLHGTLDKSAPYYYQDEVTVTCEQGYQLADPAQNTATCQADQAFSTLPECTNTNECATANGGCAGTCQDTDGSFSCACGPGYTLANDGKACDNVNECQTNNGGCSQKCVDETPSYHCECDQAGYVLYTADGTSGFALKAGETGTREDDVYYIDHTCVKVKCPDLSLPLVGGSVDTDLDSYHAGGSISFYCDLGRTMQDGSGQAIAAGTRTINCQNDGKWDVDPDPVPVCPVAKCQPIDLNALAYTYKPGSASPATEVDYGTKVEYTCTVGLKTAVTLERTCTYDVANTQYALVGDKLECPVVDCGTPVITNSMPASPASTLYGASYTVSCVEKFQLTGAAGQGGTTVACLEDGHWDYGDLACQGFVCPDPGTPHDATVSITGVTVSSTASFTCLRPGYGLSSTTALTCSFKQDNSGAEWTGTMPTCEDEENPTITCPQAVTVKLMHRVSNMAATAADNTAVSGVTSVPAHFRSDQRIFSQQTVQFMATDLKDNEVTCSVEISVEDDADYLRPVIACPASTHVYVQDGEAASKISHTPATATDSTGANTLQVTYSPADSSLDKSEALVEEKTVVYNVRAETQASQAGLATASCQFQLVMQMGTCTKGFLHTPLLGNTFFGAEPKVCSTVNGVFTCTIKCDLLSGAYFPDETISKEYTCSNDVWSPNAQVTDCVAGTEASYKFLFQIRYTIEANNGNSDMTASCNTQFDELFQNTKLSEMGQEATTECANIWDRTTGTAHSHTVTFTEFASQVDGTDYYTNFTVLVDPADSPVDDICRDDILGTAQSHQFDSLYTGLDALAGCPKLTQPEFTLTEDRTSCEPGQKLIPATAAGNAACVTCPAGTILSGGDCVACAADEYQDEVGQTACKPCGTGKGTFQDGRLKMAESDCHADCLSYGMVSDSGMPPCRMCPEDEIADTRTTCKKCPDGEKTLGGTTCQAKCAAGSYSSTGYPPCITCPENSYQDQPGQNTCLECASGEVTQGSGKTLPAECVDGAATLCAGGSGSCTPASSTACEVHQHRAVCICQTGFTGPLCAERVNPCDSSPCFGITSQCTDNQDGTYSCDCETGLSGGRCETNADDCAGSPCQNEAVCLDGVDAYTCSCRAGFTGTNCDQVDDICDPNPCDNSGTCIKLAADRYKCACADGYSGVKCADVIKACESSPCLNGGTCNDDAPGQYSCDCSSSGGFSGSRCETRNDPCTGSACTTNGKCIDLFLTRTTQCYCHLGYEGTATPSCSQLDQCSPSQCKNGASCQNLGSSYTCQACPTGYEGFNCQHMSDLCARDSPCQNGAECTPSLNAYSCQPCPAGWEGTDCDQDINECDTSPCDVTGSSGCENLENDFKCTCNTGYTGKTCSENIDDCASYPCRHGGTCRDALNDFTCECTDGWEGKTCDEAKNSCAVQDACPTNSDCYAAFDAAVCVCQPTWLKNDCSVEYDICSVASPCYAAANGNCSLNGQATQCDCETDFSGDGCQLAKDTLQTITETSITTTVDPVPCLNGYEGVPCDTEVNECQTTSCPAGKSQCYDDIFFARCHCQPGTMGQDCKDVSADYDLMFNDTSASAHLVSPVSLAAAGVTNALTISFWLRFYDNAATGNVMKVYGLPSEKLSAVASGSEFMSVTDSVITVGSHAMNILPAASINDGRWHLLNVLISATSIRVIDDQAATVVQEVSLTTPVTMPQYITIVLGSGFDPAASTVAQSQGFHGAVGELRAWSGVLTSAQLTTLISTGHGPQTGLVLGWAGYRLVGDVSYADKPSSRNLVCPLGFGGPNCNDVFPDKTAPAASCIDVSVTTGTDVTDSVFPATWTDPSDASATTVTTTKLPGDLGYGRHKVLYELRDANDNVNFCQLNVYVRARDCAEPPNPLGGSQQCQTTTASGRSYTACTPSCTGADRLCAPTPAFYTCGPSGWWNYQDQMLPFQYPTCAAVRDANDVKTAVSFVYQSPSSCPGYAAGIRAKLSSVVAQWPGLCGTGAADCSDTVNVAISDTGCPRMEIVIQKMSAKLSHQSGTPSDQTPAQVFAAILTDGSLDEPTALATGVTASGLDVSTEPRCPADYQPLDDTCVVSGPGYYHVSGENEKCPIGEFQTQPEQAQCETCPNTAQGVSTLIPGSYLQADCKVECEAGERFNTSLLLCEECELGEYQPSRGQEACLPCDQDTFTRQTASTSKDQCIKICPAGQRLLTDNTTCEACPRGEWRERGPSTGCTPCTGGYLTENEGAKAAAECTMADCQPGSYRDQSGPQEVCKPCVKAFYQAQKWQTSCEPCPITTSTAGSGATHIDNCTSLDTCPGNVAGCSPYSDCRFDGKVSTCHCRDPYMGDGKTCQHVCVVQDPCKNGGVCVKLANGSSCVCPEPWVGPDCSRNTGPGDSGYTSMVIGIVCGAAGLIAIVLGLFWLAWCMKKNMTFNDKLLIKPEDNFSVMNTVYAANPSNQLAAHNMYAPSHMGAPSLFAGPGMGAPSLLAGHLAAPRALSAYAASMMFDDDASLAGAKPPSVAVYAPSAGPGNTPSLLDWGSIMKASPNTEGFLFDDDAD